MCACQQWLRAWLGASTSMEHEDRLRFEGSDLRV
jgi:hypothetical protein